MTIDPQNPKHVIADEGKWLVRVDDGLIMGNEVFLGVRYLDKNGNKIEPPYEEQPSDYKEIDEPSQGGMDF